MTNNNNLNFASTAVSHHSIYKNQNVVLKDDQPTFKYIWEKSSTAEEDIQHILRYFENRRIPVDKSFIKALGFRMNRYNGETSIVIPIRNLQNDLVKIHQIFIDGEGNKVRKISQGSYDKDYCLKFGDGDNVIIFEGLEDAISWYLNDENSDQYTYVVTFSYTGFKHLSGFLDQYDEKLLILDNDGDNPAAVNESDCLKDFVVKRMRNPHIKYDCNNAVIDGRFGDWQKELELVEYDEKSIVKYEEVKKDESPITAFYRNEIIPRLTLEIAYPEIIFSGKRDRSAGDWITATCPFKGCKPNKFSVHRSHFGFKCFKCGSSGDLISYLKITKGFSFYQAVTYLAEALRLEVPTITEQSTKEKAILTDDDLIKRMNEKHAVVRMGSKFGILYRTPHYIKPWEEINFLRKEEFKTDYSNKNPTLTYEHNGDTQTKVVNCAKFFMKHPKRREYRGICFNPKRGFESKTHFNLYQGFNVDYSLLEEVEVKQCKLFVAHILFILASRDQKLCEYIVNWCAHAVQKPEIKPGVALVMRSTEGTGKGTFVDLFGEIFGAHYLKVSNSDHLVGKFNAHLCANLLLFADEARWAGDRSSEGVLKSLITEKEIMLEPKYFDAVPVDNFSKIIFASNMDWVVPSSKSDRRYMVFDVSDRKANDREYFTAIRTEWKNGGKEAFYKFLMGIDISKIDLVNDRPNTNAMKEQKELTMNPQEKWYQQLLIEGTFKNSEMFDPIDLNEYEKTEINSDFLLQNYDQFCKSQNVRHKLAKNDLSRFLSKHIPELNKTRKGISKTTYWIFPPLRDLRSQWDIDYNCKSDWKVPEQIENVAAAQISFLDQ